MTTQTTHPTQPAHATHEEDANLVEGWLTKDPKRWIAGAMAGLVGGIVSLGLAAVFAMIAGVEGWMPFKIPAVALLGGEAMAYGVHVGVIALGTIMHLALGAFLGFVFAQFVRTNSLSALLVMGAVWGIFAWIFIVNLFIPAFTEVRALQLPSGAAFAVMLVFGISLTSVAFFDRVLKGNSN